MKAISTVVAVLALAALARAQSSPLTPPALNKPAKRSTAATLRLGDKAPDFALPNGDGKLVALSDFTANGPVVIVFYRGFW
jgi:hypothetical protein